MTTKGPGLFSHIGKKSQDLLNKDHISHQKVTFWSHSTSGITLISTVEERRGVVAGGIVSHIKYNKSKIDIKIDTNSKVYTRLVVADIVPSTKTVASVQLPDYKSCKLEVQHIHEHTSITSTLTFSKSPTVEFSASIGTPRIAFGAEASYSVTDRKFVKYNTGLSLTKPSSCASIILVDKGDRLRASYLYNPLKLNGGGIVGEVNRKFSTNKSTLTVGFSYIADSSTTVKARLDNRGNLGALLQLRLRPKSFLTVCGAFDIKALEKVPRFGLALNLKP